MPRPARRTGIATTSRSMTDTSASCRGVCTWVGREGRSAVASKTRNVMIRRARARNSSGSVPRSRSPARQSWTTGWALTWTGTALSAGVGSRTTSGVRHRPISVVGQAGRPRGGRPPCDKSARLGGRLRGLGGLGALALARRRGPVGLPAQRGGAAHRDPDRRLLGGLGQTDGQEPVLEVGRDLVRPDALGNPQLAPQRARPPLAPDVAVALLALLGRRLRVLRGDRQQTVVDGDVDVL